MIRPGAWNKWCINAHGLLLHLVASPFSIAEEHLIISVYVELEGHSSTLVSPVTHKIQTPSSLVRKKQTEKDGWANCMGGMTRDVVRTSHRLVHPHHKFSGVAVDSYGLGTSSMTYSYLRPGLRLSRVLVYFPVIC